MKLVGSNAPALAKTLRVWAEKYETLEGVDEFLNLREEHWRHAGE